MLIRNLIHTGQVTRLVCASVALLSSCLFGQTNVLMQHNDIGRTGLNPTETILTPANVSSGGFGKLYAVPLDGLSYAQPLYMSSVSIAGANHSVVFVATEHDSVYALDANAAGTILWKASLLDSAHGASAGATPDPESDTNCTTVGGPEYGITGTPVIDSATGTLYVVSETLEGTTNPYPVQRLHALDITSGAEKFGGPVTISATVAGSGVGSSNGQLTFDPKWAQQRPGLLFLNNTIYIAWGSYCDTGPYHGWLMAYSVSTGTLQQTSAVALSPNTEGAGIWLSGAGLAADNTNSNPRLFIATGNGTYDGQTEWGDTDLNINVSKGLTISDSFTPSTQEFLAANDEDLGASAPIILPDQPGAHPHLAIQLSKASTLYLLNRDNLGGYNTSVDQCLQELNSGVYSHVLFGAPAYFNGNLYFWPTYSSMAQYQIQNGQLSNTPVAVSPIREVTKGNEGSSPSISSNGTSNGIVWANDAVSDQPQPTQYLYAFDATNVSNVLWSSAQVPERDDAGASQKFAVPTIADGKVFLIGRNQLNVYGLLQPDFTLSAVPTSLTLIPGTSSTVQISVALIGGLSTPVSLSASGLPTGVSASFSPVSSNASTLTLTAAANAPLTLGAATINVTGSSASLLHSIQLSLNIADSVQPVIVNLSSVYNVYATANDGTPPAYSGLDVSGDAYSASLLGTPVDWAGITFPIGAAGAVNGVSGGVVVLPAGNYSSLDILATAVGGSQTNQPFVVTYTDGTTTTFVQNVSDWGSSQGYAGESIASTMQYRLTPNGSPQNGPFYLYGYSFALNIDKPVQSVTLPFNRDVIVLGIALTNSPAGLSAAGNVYSTANDGTPAPKPGLDGGGYAYSATLLGTSVNWQGVTFPVGAAGTPNGVWGGTHSLPTANYSTLNILATGLNGNQVNQPFIVTYTDGTTSTFAQNLSDWGAPQNYPGESIAVNMKYRLTYNGSPQNGPFYLYAYSFALNSSKTLLNVTFPNNRNVVVLGVIGTNSAGSSSGSSALTNTGSPNVYAAATDGTLPVNGGISGGYAYSSTLLGSSVTWAGVTFPIGGTGNANAFWGGTQSLPSGNYATLDILATGVNGNQPNQSFVVTYTDGTTSTFVQNLSDWSSPQNYGGEFVAVAMPYRLTPTGAQQNGPFYLYGYSFALNNAKTVLSVTLPYNPDVIVLGIAVTNSGTSVSAPSNVYSIVSDGTAPTNGGIDGANAFSATLLGTSINWAGVTFPLGAAGTANGYWGGTHSLPTGNYTTLDILATGVNGNQLNQPFVVTYTDGTTATFVQNVSDWGGPQNYPGEYAVVTMPYRLGPKGSPQNGTFHLYGYSFQINSSKTVLSVTLPHNRSVVVLAFAVTNSAASVSAPANVYSTSNDGTASAGGGLDGGGNAYSASLLGSSVNWAGVTIPLGTAGTANAYWGGTHALPPANYTTLDILAIGLNGNQLNQSFVVTYTDGTTATFVQNLSDWGSPQNFSGEYVAVKMPYRLTASGSPQNGPFYLYGYSFALNNSKTVLNVTFPYNRNVIVLGMVATNSGTSVSAPANVYSSATDGTPPAGGGMDGGGYAYSATQLGTSVNWAGVTIPLSAAGTANAYWGGTHSLTSGNYTTLDILAAGVGGAQMNQTFIVTYTDGTTSTFVQNLSDWGGPENFSGEYVAVSMPYRLAANGSPQSGPFYLYGYSFVLNNSKSVLSVTLPYNRHVIVLGMVVTNSGTSVSAPANVYSSANLGSASLNGGLDNAGFVYPAAQLGTSVKWGGSTFSIGSAGTANAYWGGVHSLPAGQYAALDILATGVNGNQVNQSFIVTYTDGSTSTFVQSLSDWGSRTNLSGESTAVTVPYRLKPSGSPDDGLFNLHGYSFPLDSTKTVLNVTFPFNRNVVVLSMALVPAS